jgi:thioredoxin-like negative regulator of GroEL
MNQVADIIAENFEFLIKSNDNVVVEFWRKTCDNCKKFKAIYEQLPKIFGEKIRFARMRILESIENLRLAESFGIDETPTLKFFQKRKEIGEITGYRTLKEVIQEINKIVNV